MMIKLQHNARNNSNNRNERVGKKRLADPTEKQLFPEELAWEQYREVSRGQTNIRARIAFQEQGDQRNVIFKMTFES